MNWEDLDAQDRQILVVRAEKLRAFARTEVEHPDFWIAEFAVGDQPVALPLEMLRATVSAELVTAVPGAPSYVLGILRYEGEIVPVYSLASLVGVRGWREDPAAVVVVDLGAGKLMGIDCEAVPRPVAVSRAAARPEHGQGKMVELSVGEGRTVSLLDLERLLAEREGVHGP